MDRDELLRAFPAHRPRLVASLARMVGVADAEELATETLLRALEAVDGFRGEAGLGTWLHRIGVNLAHDLLRRRERSPVVSAESDDALPDVAADASGLERFDQQQMSECVRNLLATLPPRQRDVLAQADMFDRTAPEIARNSGITAGNVKIRLHRARQSMQAVLEAHCDFDCEESGVLCCTPKSGD